jgi:hypothetical protein
MTNGHAQEHWKPPWDESFGSGIAENIRGILWLKLIRHDSDGQRQLCVDWRRVPPGKTFAAGFCERALKFLAGDVV